MEVLSEELESVAVGARQQPESTGQHRQISGGVIGVNDTSCRRDGDVIMTSYK